MRAKILTPLLVAAMAATTAAASAAPAPTTAPDAPHARASVRWLANFDHGESLRPGTVVRDASGHRHPGRVLVERRGALRVVSGHPRKAAAFPTRGRAIVEVPDGSGLDPQRRDFVFGATIRVTRQQSTFGANIVQKGYFNQPGGQWKLQLAPGGVPSCVVYGALERIKITAQRGIANGSWHTVTCSRTHRGVVLRVDGRERARADGWTGFVGNDSPVRVGGKKIGAGNKQFHGVLDSVFLRTT